MSIVDLDSWITEYNGCERLSREINSQLVLRNREPHLSTEYSRLSGQIRVRLRQFSNELEELKKKLQHSSRSRKITTDEAERRHRQLEVLQSSLLQLQNQFKTAGETVRDQLFAQPQSSRLFENDDSDDEPPILADDSVTVQDLRKQQSELINNQDRGLEALSQVISRQKHLAIQIGDEVETQNEIIDDLAVTMENTDGRIHSETQNIVLVDRKDATCSYYVVIGILFVAIVVLIFV